MRQSPGRHRSAVPVERFLAGTQWRAPAPPRNTSKGPSTYAKAMRTSLGLASFSFQPSKGKPHLQLQSAVIGALGENRASRPRRLIGLPEKRRRDVPDDWPWIVVVGEVANLHRDN